MRPLYTIDTETAQVRYAGNGVTTVFSVAFQFFEPTTLRVQTVVDETATLRVLNVDYTVSGGAGETGTVTFVTAPPTGTTIVIDLDMPFTQETIDLAPNGPLPAEDVEQGFDRVVTMVKQLNARQGSTPRLSAAYDPDDGEITLPVPAAGEFLMGNAGGTGWVNASFPVPSGPDGNHPEFYAADYGVATGNSASANTSFLTAAIAAVAALGGGRIMLPQGQLSFSPFTITGGNNVQVCGQGAYGGTTLLFENTTGDCITLSTYQHLKLSNVHISTLIRRTSGFAIRVEGDAFQPTLENIRIDYHFNGIDVDQSSDVRMSNITMLRMLGNRGIQFWGRTGSIYDATIRDVLTDNQYLAGGADAPVVTRTDGMTVAQFDIILSDGKIYQASTGGVAGTGTAPAGIPGTGSFDAFTATIADGAVRWNFICSAYLMWLLMDSRTYSIVGDNLNLINGAYQIFQADSEAGVNTFPIWLWVNLEGDHSFYDAVTLSGGEGFVAKPGSWISSVRRGNGLVVGAGYKGGVKVEGSRIFGSWYNGIVLNAGPVDVKIRGNEIGHNSIAANNTYSDIAIGGDASEIDVTGNTLGAIAYTKYSGVPIRTAFGVLINTGAGSDIVVMGNRMKGHQTAGLISAASGANVVIKNNAGYADETQGTGTIASGATTAVVTHGLSFTPAAKNVVVNFTEQATNDYGRVWLSNFTSTQFTVNVSADPGASGLDFEWAARR